MEAADVVGCDLAAEVVGVFGRIRLRVSGTSMAPTLCPGELVIVENTRMTEILPGEIVVFARDGRLIVHRVLSKIQSRDEDSLLTRGDRARKSDAPVTSSEFVGRVIHIEGGHSGVLATSRRTLASRAVSGLLRFSDRGTYLYLRIAARWHGLVAWRTACRA
jgi:signal peptidase I